MGELAYTDPFSKKQYIFEFDGETPTDKAVADAQQIIRADRETFGQRYTDYFGTAPEEPDDGTLLGREYRRTRTSGKENIGGLIEDAGNLAGLDFLKDYGTRMEKRAKDRQFEQALEQASTPETVRDFREVYEDGFDFNKGLSYLGGLAGGTAASAANMLQGGGYGAAIGGSAGLVTGGLPGLLGGATTGFGYGTTAGLVAPFAGNNLARTKEELGLDEAGVIDLAKAIGAGYVQALSEKFGLKYLAKMGFNPNAVSKKLAARFIEGGTKTSIVEGSTETFQQAIERLQAGLPLLNAEGREELLQAFVGGIVLGGGVGSVGSVSPFREKETAPKEVEAVAPKEIEAVAPKEIEAVAPKEIEAVAPKEVEAAEELNQEDVLPPDAAEAIQNYSVTYNIPYNDAETVYDFGKNSGIINPNNVTTYDLLEAHDKRNNEEAQAGGGALVSELESSKKEGNKVKSKPKAEGKVQTTVEREVVDADVAANVTGQEAAIAREAENAIDPSERRTPVQRSEDLSEVAEDGIDTGTDGTGVDPSVLNADTATQEAVNTNTKQLDPPTDGGLDGSSGNIGAANVPETAEQLTLKDTAASETRRPVNVQNLTETDPSVVMEKIIKEQRNATVARFVDFRNTNPDMAVYHDEFISDKDTDVDYFQGDLERVNKLFRKKNRIAEQEGGSDTEVETLTPEEEAAITFFERFERPEYALEEIAARTQIDVSDKVAGAGKIDLLPDADRDRMSIATTAASFLEPFNKDTANLAEKWVAANLTPEINEVYNKERDAAAERIKIDRRAKFKVDLPPVQPRPKGKGPDVAQQQAAWDSSYKSSHFNTGKPRPTMSEQVATGAKAVEEETNRRFAEQQENIAIAEASRKKLTAVTELPVELQKPITEVKAVPIKKLLTEKQLKNVSAVNKEEYGGGKKATAKQKKEVKELRDNFTVDINAELYADYFDPRYKRLLSEFVVDRHLPLDPVTMTMLEDSNLSDALKEFAKNGDIPTRAFAKFFAKYAGNTQVQFADRGTQIAGYFDPRTNTITFNSNIPTTGHVLLHEMAHAVTSQQIATNPQSAPVKMIRKVYEDLKDILPASASNLDEFVAEFYANPDLRTTLSGIMDKGQYGSARTRMVKAISRMFKRLQVAVGLAKATERRTVLDLLDPLVDQLVNPAPSFRDADALQMIAHNPDAVNKVFEDAVTNGPEFNEAAYKKYDGLVKSTLQDKAGNAGNIVKTAVMQLTPLHNIVRLAEKYAPSAPKINDLMNQAGGEIQELYDKVNGINNGVIRWAKKASQKDVDAFNRLNNIGTAYRVDPTLDEKAARKRYSGDLYDKIYKLLRKDYVRLSKGQGGKLYMQSRNMFKGLLNELSSALDVRLEASGIPAEARQTLRKSFYDRLVQRGMIEPYAPLERDKGDYWFSINHIDPLTGRMERYTDAFEGPQARDNAGEKITKNAAEDIAEAYAKANAMDERTLIDNEGFRRIKTELDSRISTGMAQDAAIRDFMEIEVDQQLNVSRYINKAPPASFVRDLMSQLSKNKEISPELQNEIGNLILDTLPETSYLQSFRQRKGGDLIGARMGYNPDSIKAISDNSRSLTRQIVNMKYKSKLQQAISAVEAEMNANPEQTPAKAMYLQTLDEYAKAGPMPERSKLSRFATAAGFNMTLGLNVSGGLVNLSQIPLVTLPYLGGKHGYPQTMRAIGATTSLLQNSGLKRKIETYGEEADTTMDTEIDAPMSISNINTANVTPAQQKALDKMGMTPEELQVLITTGIDLGQFKRSLDYEIMDVENMSGIWAKVNRVTGFMQHHGERINREVALGAAYSGELNNMSPADRADPQQLIKAAQQAVYDVETTNGGIAAGAAPPLARTNLGAVVFMFKRYGVSMIAMLGELVLGKKGVFGTGASLADRRLAAFQLAGIYGSASLLAGAQGVPGFGLGTMAVNTALSIAGFDPGGEDDDAKTMARAYLGDGPYKGAVNYYTGVNIASRIGLGELLYRDTMIDRDWPLLFRLGEQLGGPVVGIYMNTDRGLKQMGEAFGKGDGDAFYRGVETIMPAAMKNAMRAMRFSPMYEDGAYTRDGKPILQDIHPLHIAGQFFGFTPTAYSAQMETNARAMKLQKSIVGRRGKLYDMFSRAYFDGDADGQQYALEQIAEYNEDYPEYPILADNLMKSLRGRIKNRATSFHGTTLNPRLKSRIVADAQRYGDPTTSMFD